MKQVAFIISQVLFLALAAHASEPGKNDLSCYKDYNSVRQVIRSEKGRSLKNNKSFYPINVRFDKEHILSRKFQDQKYKATWYYTSDYRSFTCNLTHDANFPEESVVVKKGRLGSAVISEDDGGVKIAFIDPLGLSIQCYPFRGGPITMEGLKELGLNLDLQHIKPCKPSIKGIVPINHEAPASGEQPETSI
jgi:hypothetical protein